MAAEMSGNVFQILEIEPTTDKKEIKRAYARLVKRYHPEEFPEEWEKIHGAYEQALKMAEQGKPLMREEASVQTEAPKLPVQEKDPAAEPPVQEKDPEAELPVQEEHSEAESPEMDALFDNIGEMAREKHHQDQEVFKRRVQEVMNDFRKISGEKELDIKEWEAFFHQGTRLPYICTREFLELLGDCFENRTIEYEMYQFLKEQLAVIKRYSWDEQIELQNIGLLNPVDYAEKKIYKAYAGESAYGSGDDAGTRKRKTRKAVWIILIIVGSFLRSAARYANYTRDVPKIQEIPITTLIENEIDNAVENADKDMEETAGNDTVGNTMADTVIEREGNTIRMHMSSAYSGMIQVGDARETMIEVMGEPEEIRESQEDPDYEEAVYSLSQYGDRLVIVLENDVITDIYAEHTMEGVEFDINPVTDSE